MGWVGGLAQVCGIWAQVEELYDSYANIVNVTYGCAFGIFLPACRCTEG